MKPKLNWSERFVTGIAEAATGSKGAEALRQFSKQLVIGATRDEGSEDMEAVFKQELVCIYDRLQVLTQMSFVNNGKWYRWTFDEPWVLDSHAWHERRCAGLVLVGMDQDCRFFFVKAEEATHLLQVGMGKVVARSDAAVLEQWEKQWNALRGV